MRGAIVFVAMICVVQFAVAQIRIIPQEHLEKANPQTALSTLQFVPASVGFGTIDEMSGVWQGRAQLRNGGADTVVITRVKSTCGCLVADMAKRVLAPRETIDVTLKYYPRGHAGKVVQRVLLYSNLSDDKPSAILQLRGLVTASADRSDDYPYSRGLLRLRQEVVHFSGEGREVQRVACMNGGSTELRLAVDAMLLPEGFKVRFEPEVLAPKQEGDMVVEYLPSGVQRDSVSKIYIKGLGVPPRQSTVTVEIKKRF